MPDIAIIFLSILFLLQLFLPKTQLNRVGFSFFALSAVLVFGFAGFQSWQQYHIWLAGETTKFLLPPYQTFDYFIYYARYHFFNPYLISLLIGLLFFFGAKKMNKKYGERFFEPVEPYLLLISLFLSGTPGWLAYLIFLLLANLAGNLYLTYKFYKTDKSDSSDKAHRVSFYYYWLPSAIFTILISRWLAILPIWQTMKF